MLSFSFTLCSAGTARATIRQVLFFFLFINYHLACHVVDIRWSFIIIIIIIIIMWKFFIPALADGFHWLFSDSRSSQVSRTLPSIPTDLNNVVFGMVSTPFLISIAYSSFADCIDTTDFNWYYRHFPVPQPGRQNPQFGWFSSFSWAIIKSGCLAAITLAGCITKSQRSLCVSFSWTEFVLCK